MTKVAQIVCTPKSKLSVFFEDNHLIVISKPAGLLSQGDASGDPNLVDCLRKYFGRHYVGLVHRLDRGTSGLMVIAKRSKAAQRLTDALQEGKVTRLYTAWVCGHLPKEVHWKHRLEKDERTNTVKVVKAGGKVSILSGRALQYLNQYTLAEFHLDTGRSHQIRVQCAYEGFPLLGDRKYSKESFSRMALHSTYLEFPHPMSGELLKFEDPMPQEMNNPSAKNRRD